MLNRHTMSAMADEFRKIAAAAPQQQGQEPPPQQVSSRLTWAPGSAFITRGGSMVHGSPKRGEDREAEAFLNSRLVPDLIHHAEGALRQGRKVVCLSEGGVQGEDGSEQRVLAAAIDQLHRKPQHAGRILHDSWDDEEVRAIGETEDGHPHIDREAPIFKRLVKVFKDPDLVDAALQAGLSGEGKKQTGQILASAQAQSKLIALGAPTNNVKKLQMLARPEQHGGPRTQLSAVMEHYDHERRRNLVKKLKEHEEQGNVVVTAPHHGHLQHVQAALRS